MSLNYAFQPVNMLKLLAKLDRLPSGGDRWKRDNAKDEQYLQKLVTRLAYLSEEQARQESYALTIEEMVMIADYIATNRFNLRLKSLIALLKERKRRTLFQHLLQAWKMFFGSKAVCECLSEYFADEAWMLKSKVSKKQNLLFL